MSHVLSDRATLSSPWLSARLDAGTRWQLLLVDLRQAWSIAAVRRGLLGMALIGAGDVYKRQTGAQL